MTALLLGLLSNILPGLVSDVTKRVLPAEKMSEAEKAQLANALTIEVMKQDWSGIEAEYKDRADARLLAAADVSKGNAVSNFLAATVRPVWGYASLVLYGVAMVKGIAIPPAVQSAVELVIMFFFGGRTIEKLAPAITGIWSKK